MAVSRMNSEVGRVLGRRYRIVAPIGMGASAQVFLADDARLRRRVAVKMLHEALADDADFLRRFRAEARAAAALSHPNVVAVFDWGDEDVPFIVTEFLAGGSLRAMLDAGALLTPGQALLVGLETARALDYAHRRGLIHRDIKPANLLFGDEGRLRVADFGLARALAEAAWTEPQGAVLGTARYASPEQATGQPLDGKADVYSLALILVEAVTGKVPFVADTTLGTLMARVDRSLEVPHELGVLRRVLELAGRADPEQRIDARTMAGGLLSAARRLGRPEPLVLAGALTRDGFLAIDEDPTLHLPRVDDAIPAAEMIDLRDDDLDLEPPDWVSSAEPSAAAMDVDPDVHVDGLPDLRWRATSPPEPEIDDVEPGQPGDHVSGEISRRGLVGGNDLSDTTDVLPRVPSGPGSDEVAGRSAEGPAAGAREVSTDQSAPKRRGHRRLWAALAFLMVVAAATVTTLLLTDRPVTDRPVTDRPVTDRPTDRTAAIPTFRVPDLAGRTEASAREAVSKYRWKVTSSHGRRDGTKPGQVIRTDPPIGTRVRRGGRLRLVISDGNTLATVPTGLGGQPAAAVQVLLLKLGLVANLSPQFDERVPKDVVIGVVGGTPARLPKGQGVPIVVSAGPKPRLVPTGLVGAAEADARTRLAAVQFTMPTTKDFSETVAVGHVISVQPPSGTSAPRGSSVTIKVSNGPRPRVVPSGLVGATETDARTRVAAEQLTVTTTKEFSDTVAAGDVISVQPGSGTSVPRGSAVTISVSKGPDLVTVPRLDGATSIDAAVGLLTRAGLSAGNVSGPASGRPKSTKPAAGQRVKRGSAVDIVLG